MSFNIDEVNRINRNFQMYFSADFSAHLVQEGVPVSIAHQSDTNAKPSITDIFFKIREINNSLFYALNTEIKKNQQEDDALVTDVLSLFKIDQSNQSYIFKESEPSLVIKGIAERCNVFVDQFTMYVDDVDHKNCEKNKKSFSIISKTLKSRISRLEKSLYRMPMDGFSELELKKQIVFLVQKGFADIICDVIRPIALGLRESNLYVEAINIFNAFLADFSIHTKCLAPGYKLEEDEWEMIEPQESNDATTSKLEMKDVIKEVISFPYFLRYENSEILVREGEVIMWKVVA